MDVRKHLVKVILFCFFTKRAVVVIEWFFVLYIFQERKGKRRKFACLLTV